MTEETTTETTEEVEEVEAEADGPKQLRAALKREQAKSAALTTQLMETAYAEAKLDPTTGLGKAIAKEYKGDPTTEALLAFAKEEYDYELTATPENSQAPVIAQGQAQLDTMNASSVPVTPETELDALQTATAEGDWETAGRIKADQMKRIFQNR